jgi:lipopolysaccharide/colanic/teichoic acid biosynthesis glycosyltransferase
MTTSTLSSLNIYSSVDQQHSNNYLPHCILKWRQGLLFVSLGQQTTQPYISAFETKQQLVECLKQSPVRLVVLHPTLGETTLKLWADACEQANKPVFLRRTIQKKFQKQGQLSLQPKQWMESIAAFLLLLLVSPIILATAILIYLYSPQPILPRQWYIGTGGKLFRLLKFPTTVANENSRSTLLIRWMCKYNVDKLPQLFHVLRGEISLRDSFCPLTLSEAVRLGSETQQYVSILLEIPEDQSQQNN